jgi:hypothetical protein
MVLNTRRCTISWKDSLFKDVVEQYLGVVVVEGVLDDGDHDFEARTQRAQIEGCGAQRPSKTDLGKAGSGRTTL